MKKYLFYIILPVIFFICTLTASAQVNLGDATLETGTGTRGAGNIEAWDKFTTATSYTISGFVLYQNVTGGTGTMHVGLYSDASGIPGSLVSGSDGGAITVSSSTGWITYTITPFTLPAGTYWIATNFSANNPTNWSRKAATGTHVYKLSVGYTALPSSWPSGSSSETNGPVSMYFVACSTITTTAGYNNPVCAGSTISLTASNASGGISPYTYNWTGPNSYTSTSQNPSIANSTTAMNGTYAVTVTDHNGCTGSSNVIVTVNTLPTASVNAGDQHNLSCNLGTDGSIKITGSGGSGGYSFSIDNGSNYYTGSLPILPYYQGGGLFNGLPANTYQIRVKDNHGCESKKVQ